MAETLRLYKEDLEYIRSISEHDLRRGIWYPADDFRALRNQAVQRAGGFAEILRCNGFGAEVDAVNAELGFNSDPFRREDTKVSAGRRRVMSTYVFAPDFQNTRFAP